MWTQPEPINSAEVHCLSGIYSGWYEIWLITIGGYWFRTLRVQHLHVTQKAVLHFAIATIFIGKKKTTNKRTSDSKIKHTALITASVIGKRQRACGMQGRFYFDSLLLMVFLLFSSRMLSAVLRVFHGTVFGSKDLDHSLSKINILSYSFYSTNQTNTTNNISCS